MQDKSPSEGAFGTGSAQAPAPGGAASIAGAASAQQPSYALTYAAPIDVASTGGRIHVLDILRGMALAGMILVHFHQNTEVEVGGAEDLIAWITWIGVETKAWGVFALLFGVGFAVLLRRLEAKRLPVVRTYLRRLAGLAMFGIVAELFFGFQILLEYAMWGVPLLLIRRWPSWALLLTALLAVALPGLALSAMYVYRSANGEQTVQVMDPLSVAVMDERAAEAGDDYPALLSARARVMWHKYTNWLTYLPTSSFTLFILGLLAVRHRVFDEPLSHVLLIIGWALFGLLSWGIWWLLWLFAPEEAFGPWKWSIYSGFGLIHDQWLCLTYVGAIVLLTAWWPAWIRRLSFFGTAGRMALTNYMLQIAVLDFLSSGYGVGLRARPVWSIVGTVLLFGALVMLSTGWLARFRYGPAEWLWRSITYGARQPLRK